MYNIGQRVEILIDDENNPIGYGWVEVEIVEKRSKQKESKVIPYFVVQFNSLPPTRNISVEECQIRSIQTNQEYAVRKVLKKK